MLSSSDDGQSVEGAATSAVDDYLTLDLVSLLAPPKSAVSTKRAAFALLMAEIVLFLAMARTFSG